MHATVFSSCWGKNLASHSLIFIDPVTISSSVRSGTDLLIRSLFTVGRPDFPAMITTLSPSFFRGVRKLIVMKTFRRGRKNEA